MSDAMHTHGALSWCELMTDDVEAARAFYTGLIGYEAREMMPGVVLLEQDGKMRATLRKKPMTTGSRRLGRRTLANPIPRAPGLTIRTVSTLGTRMCTRVSPTMRLPWVITRYHRTMHTGSQRAKRLSLMEGWKRSYAGRWTSWLLPTMRSTWV